MNGDWVHVLARVELEDQAGFIDRFKTIGVELRRAHGSLGVRLLREVDSPDRLVLLFTWQSREAFEAFLADPTVRAAIDAETPIGESELVFLEMLEVMEA